MREKVAQKSSESTFKQGKPLLFPRQIVCFLWRKALFSLVRLYVSCGKTVGLGLESCICRSQTSFFQTFFCWLKCKDFAICLSYSW